MIGLRRLLSSLLAVCISLVLVSAAHSASTDDTGSAHGEHGYEVPPPDPASLGGPFSLLDQHGNAVTERTFVGRWSWVYFGYASCAEACPTALQTMAAAADLLDRKGIAVQPIFVDFGVVYARMQKSHGEHVVPIDPIEFARSIHPRLMALTGTRREMFAMLRQFKSGSNTVRSHTGRRSLASGLITLQPSTSSIPTGG